MPSQRILIASPLEPEHVERIRAFDPAAYRVEYRPDLLAKPRYVADHRGHPRELSDAQRAEWRSLMSEADIFFDFDHDEPANLPRLAPRLKWVQATSSGIGEYLRRHGLDRTGIQFTTAAGVHARPLAEFAMLGLLYFFRDVPYLNARKAERHWERYTVEGLDGARVLVVGLGALGGAVARDLANFGCEVIGARRSTGASMPEGVSRMIANNEIRQVLPEVDALVLACPMTDETRGLIDRACVEGMKPGAVIVNISRGPVIDQQAMYEALATGRLRGAALDVFEVEPLPKESPFWDLPNVLISPHSASTVNAENRRITDIFLDNLGRYARGETLRNLYDADRGY